MLSKTSTPLQSAARRHRAALSIECRTQLSKLSDNSETLILFRPSIIQKGSNPEPKGRPKTSKGPRNERHGSTMARVIEFYIPENYHPKPKSALVPIIRGKVIVFPTALSKRSA